MPATRHCRECAALFQPTKAARHGDVIDPRRVFCSTLCRKAFNNRRAVRGAELYDLFRACRRERELAKELSLWTSVCRLEEKWQDEDDRDRPGRRSYAPPREALMKLVNVAKIRRDVTPNQVKASNERRRLVNAAKDRARKEERENACN